MNLARHSITATAPVHILDIRLEPDARIFTIATPQGFAVYRTCPLSLLRKRELSGGTLSQVVPLHTSSLLFLVGGGASPLYPPNKVILWDDVLGREVAELEFRERVRGLACRRGWLAVSLRRRVVVFQVGEQVTRYGEWETCDNPSGLLAIATNAYSTLLAIAGRKTGHVQLIHLPPCPPPVSRDPPPPGPPRKPPAAPSRPLQSIMIDAHTSALTTLTVPPSGRLVATTSERGTLVRIWDTHSGKPVGVFRRGTDKAEIYGVAFRPDEREFCVWSDKGTVHVFALGGSDASNRKSSFSPLAPFIPLPKYFDSEWSYAQYRIPTQSAHIALSSTSSRTPANNAELPDEERCVVGWIGVPVDDGPGARIAEYQLLAITHRGGWYRLGLPTTPKQRRASMSSSPSRAAAPSSAGSGWRVPASLAGSPPKHASAAHYRMSSAASSSSRLDKGKDRERDKGDKEKETTECTLLEFRRFGRWDGWS
ncbi:hypothetical protein HGRIS_009735 [Hohenbuehelia grisea]|uniref:SVP1-like protein 2 n=1 Tax=Hohenbuehelia grisea TaxID=104357 RepID=A0ABR3J273_9AGAR